MMYDWGIIKKTFLESDFTKVSEFRKHGKVKGVDIREISDDNWYTRMVGMNIEKRKQIRAKEEIQDRIVNNQIRLSDPEEKKIEVIKEVAREIAKEVPENKKKGILELTLKEFNTQVTHKVSRKALGLIAGKLDREGENMSAKDLLAIYKETKELEANNIDLDNFELAIPITLKKVLKGETVDAIDVDYE